MRFTQTKTFQDDDDHHHQLNSRTIKEFPEDHGTLVPEKDNLDGTMIAHTDCGTLVPDSGTMVELESNLGTMVINSDSEDSTMKSNCKKFYIGMLNVNRNMFCLLLFFQNMIQIRINQNTVHHFSIILIGKKLMQ